MTSTTLRLEECCRWCRQPISHCTKPSCDDTKTYAGVLNQGVWREAEQAERRREPALATAR